MGRKKCVGFLALSSSSVYSTIIFYPCLPFWFTVVTAHIQQSLCKGWSTPWTGHKYINYIYTVYTVFLIINNILSIYKNFFVHISLRMLKFFYCATLPRVWPTTIENGYPWLGEILFNTCDFLWCYLQFLVIIFNAWSGQIDTDGKQLKIPLLFLFFLNFNLK